MSEERKCRVKWTNKVSGESGFGDMMTQAEFDAFVARLRLFNVRDDASAALGCS